MPPDEFSDEPSDYIAALETLIAAIEDPSNEDIHFVLYQNAIRLFQPGSSVGDPTIFSITVPVLHLGNCVNLEYFTSTPEYYALTADSNNEVYWDFDEDGSLDIVTVTNTGDDYVPELEISYNGKIIDSSGVDIADAYDISWVIMVHTDSGYYLYVEFAEENPTHSTHVFHLENEDFKYVGRCEEIYEFPYNPTSVPVAFRSDLVGTGHFEVECTLIGNNGLPDQTTSYFAKDALAVTVKDMTLGAYDSNGDATGDIVTVPAGTSVRLIGVDEAKEMAYFTTLNTDPSQNQNFKMLVYKNSYGSDPYDFDFDVYFDGEGAYELFTGAPYYD